MKNIRYLMIGFIAVFIISGLFGCGEQAFFPTENSGDLKYAIRYLFTEETMGSAETNLDIDQIEIYNNAKVISVSLPQLSGIPEERLLLGYFLVEGNSIRKLNTGYMERLDREYLNDTIKMEELLREASIVCQDEPITDPLNQNEKGRHQALTVNGNRREYHSYSNLTETGYYETFVWDLEKGLLAYKSGFGAVAQSIELSLIE